LYSSYTFRLCLILVGAVFPSPSNCTLLCRCVLSVEGTVRVVKGSTLLARLRPRLSVPSSFRSFVAIAVHTAPRGRGWDCRPLSSAQRNGTGQDDGGAADNARKQHEAQGRHAQHSGQRVRGVAS
jgi:hypothetical protein